jgi:hypothetical protein
MIAHDVGGPLRVDVPLLRPSPYDEGEATPLINLSVQPRRILEQAQGPIETAIGTVHTPLGALVRQVTWSADHRWIRLSRVGFSVEMEVDAQESTSPVIFPCCVCRSVVRSTWGSGRIPPQTVQK